MSMQAVCKKCKGRGEIDKVKGQETNKVEDQKIEKVEWGECKGDGRTKKTHQVTKDKVFILDNDFNDLEKMITGIPLIFLSDFNTNRDTLAFKQFENAYLNHSTIMKSVYDLDDKEHLNSLKWRRTGDQAYKCRRIDQSVDFIFYSTQDFKLKGYLTIPTKDHVINVTKGVRMPFWNYPSDHFCIGADLEFAPSKGKVERSTD